MSDPERDKVIKARETARYLEKCTDEELESLMCLFSERLVERFFERFKERIYKLGI